MAYLEPIEFGEINKKMMMKLGYKMTLLIATIVLMSACSGTPQKTRTDTNTTGVARMVVDECFAPIIQQQVDVFESTYLDAVIIPIYTSENEAFKLFMDDSVRLIVAARDLTREEKDIIVKRGQYIRSQRLAKDGVALIINNQNPDSLITVSDIEKIMTGEVSSWKELNPQSKQGNINVVFDSPNSSTARYINESICKGKPFGKGVKAVGQDTDMVIDASDKTTNQQVIDYVASNPNAIGVVGVNWVSNPSDTTSLTFTNTVRVMSVSSEEVATPKNSYKPIPGYLALEFYPLNRHVYITLTDIRSGLPAGFVKFAAGEKGQRIVNKSGLYPATVPTRMVNIIR